MHTRWTPLIAVLLLASACSSGDDDATAPTTTPPATTAPTPPTTAVPTTTTTPATTTTAAVDEETAVITAYLAYWDTFFAVTNPGQPDSPLIDQVATGRAAERLREIAAERVTTNTAYRQPEQSVATHDVAIIELVDGTATVRDCFVDDSYRQDLATGSIDDDDLETNLISATLINEGQQWRLAAVPTLLRQWPGANSCAQ